jgi:hypothetical protein
MKSTENASSLFLGFSFCDTVIPHTYLKAVVAKPNNTHTLVRKVFNKLKRFLNICKKKIIYLKNNKEKQTLPICQIMGLCTKVCFSNMQVEEKH